MVLTPFIANAQSAPSSQIILDQKGDQWISLLSGDQKAQLIKLSEMSDDEFLKEMDSFDLKNIPGSSLKRLGPEYVKFSFALMLVQVKTCFANANSLTNLSLIAAPTSPTCVSDFLAHLTDWRGWVGFYFFIMSSQATSQVGMKILLESRRFIGQPKSLPKLQARIGPYLGYLGMTVGSLTSQVIEHFLRSPSWSQCIKLMSEEGLTSTPCKEAFTDFLSQEDFWDDFWAGSTSMVSASIAAAITQQLVTCRNLMGGTIKMSTLCTAAANKLKILAGKSGAIDLFERVGIRAIKGIRIVKNLYSLTGLPGITFSIVTEVGSFYAFLMWDHVLKNPFSRTYYDLNTSGNVNKAIEDLKIALKENQKLNWQKPFLTHKKECYLSNINAQGELETACESRSIDPLVLSLKTLSNGASRYRKKVLLNPLDDTIAQWTNKVSSYLKKYKAAKIVMEYLINEREKQSDFSFSFDERAFYVFVLWHSALEKEINKQTTFSQNLQPLLDKISRDFNIQRTQLPIINLDGENMDSIFATYKKHYNFDTVLNEQAKNNIRQNILKIKQFLLSRGANDFSSSSQAKCQKFPLLCKAQDMTLAATWNQDNDRNDHSKSRAFILSLYSIFGEMQLNEITWDLICSHNTKLELKNLNNNGSVATLSLPRLVRFSDEELARNCSDKTFLQNKKMLDTSSALQPWVYNGDIYDNIFDLLASSKVQWYFGNTSDGIQEWWTKDIFTPTTQFMFEMAKLYQNHLNEKLMIYIDNVKNDQLVAMSAPQMRGTLLDHHIVTGNLDILNKPSISLSLMGQVRLILDAIQYNWPGDNADTISQLELAFADYILNIRYPVRLSSMERVWSEYQAAIVAKDVGPREILAAQVQFDEKFQEAVLGKERLLRLKLFRERIVNLKNILFQKMSGIDYNTLSGMDKLKLKKRAQETIANESNYVEISVQEHKKFIAFELLNESLNKILIEIDQLYDKMAAKPFIGM